MKRKDIARLLRFLRITDEKGDLSLTNLGLIASLAVLLQRPEVDLQTLGTFVAALVGYQSKRFASTTPVSPEQDTAELRAALAKLETTVTALTIANQQTRR